MLLAVERQQETVRGQMRREVGLVIVVVVTVDVVCHVLIRLAIVVRRFGAVLVVGRGQCEPEQVEQPDDLVRVGL